MKLQLKANRRTAEYRISNVEGWFRFAQSFDFKIDRIHYSMLDARVFDAYSPPLVDSMFISFSFDLTGRLRPAAALI
jgi:hypothetical protein